MKRMLLLFLVVSLFSCRSEKQELQLDLKNQRMAEFQKYKVETKVHSDYLQYVFGKMNSENMKVYRATRSGVGNVSPEFYNDLCEITTSFIKENSYEIPGANFSAEILGKKIVDPYFVSLTRADSVLPGKPFVDCEIVDEFLTKVDKLPVGLAPEQYEDAVENLLLEDNYIVNTTDNEFFALAVTAAVSIDSYEYWSENYLDWAADIFGEDMSAQAQQSFWRKVWTEIKRLTKEDAKSVAQHGIEILIGGGVVGGVQGVIVGAAISAGVGSTWAAFEPFS